eukprot:894701_1
MRCWCFVCYSTSFQALFILLRWGISHRLLYYAFFSTFIRIAVCSHFSNQHSQLPRRPLWPIDRMMVALGASTARFGQAARPAGPSPEVVDFWITQIMSIGPDAEWWLDIHECRLLLDGMIQGAISFKQVIDDPPNSILAAVGRALASPRSRRGSQKKNEELYPPPSALQTLKEHDAAKQYPWLTFETTFRESILGRDSFFKIGEALLAFKRKKAIKDVVKKLGLDKQRSIGQSLIRRWASFALFVEPDEPLLPLYWQMFFALYFSRIEHGQFGKGNESGYFGYQFLLGRSGSTLLATCIDRLGFLGDHFSRLATDDPMPLRLKLVRLFRAMLMWISTAHVGDLMHEIEISMSPESFWLEKLLPLSSTNVFESSRRHFWWDLVDIDGLQASVVKHCEDFVPFKDFDNQSPGPDKEKKHPNIRMRSSPIDMTPPMVNAECLALDLPTCLRLPVDQAAGGRAPKDAALAVKTAASSYENRLSLNSALDAQFMESVPDLYRNVETQSRFEQACSHNHKCRGKALFVLQHKQCKKIALVENTISGTHEGLVQCTVTPEISLEFCGELIRISKVIRFLIDFPTASNQSLGMEWLFDLVDTMSIEVREYPPTAKFVPAAIKSLAHISIQPILAHQIKILRTMGRNPHLIPFLCPSLNPPETHFVELFRVGVTVMWTCGKASEEVLDRFDLERWLIRNPPLTERTEFFRICASSLRDEMGKSDSDNLEPTGACVGLMARISRISQFNFPELHGCLLSFAIAGLRTRDVPSRVWKLLSECPLSMLPWAEIQNSTKNLSDAFWAHRRSLLAHGDTNTLFSACDQHISYLHEFIVRLFEAAAPHAIRNPQLVNPLWDGLWQVYGPWISPVIMDSATRNLVPSSPWKSEEDYLAVAALNSLVDCARALASVDELTALRRVWAFMCAHVTGQSEGHVVAVMWLTFGRVEWANYAWRIDVSVIKEMKSLMDQFSDERSMETALFLTTILNQVDWSACFLSEESKPYTLEFLSLVVMILTNLAFPCPDAMVNFSTRLRQTKWCSLSVEQSELLLEKVSEVLYGSKWKAVSRRSQSRRESYSSKSPDALSQLDSAEDRAAFILDLMRLVVSDASSDEISVDVERMQKIRLFSEWILSAFLETGPAPLCRPAQYANIASALLADLSASLQSPGLDPLCADRARVELVGIAREFLSLMNLSQKNIQLPEEMSKMVESVLTDFRPLAPFALTAACRCLLSLKKLALVAERCIDSIFQDGDPDWEAVESALEIPELAEEEFLSECVHYSAVHTLHAVAIIKHKSISERNNMSDLQSLFLNVSEWLKDIDVQAVDHTKLIPLWWAVLDWQTTLVHALCAAHPDVHTVARRKSGLHDADKVVTRLSRMVAKCESDTVGWSMLSAIGIGGKSSHLPEFRIAARAIHIFLQLLCDSKGGYTWWKPEFSQVSSETRTRSGTELRKLADHKSYAPLKEKILNVHGLLVKTPFESLMDFRPFFRHICAVLFPKVHSLLPDVV